MSDSEYEITEEMVLAELTGVIDPDVLKLDGKTAKMLNIASDRPVLQVGPYLFSGEYSYPCGTNVLFEEKEDLKDPSKKTLKFFSTVDKNMTLCTAFLKQKDSDEAQTSQSGPSERSLPEQEKNVASEKSRFSIMPDEKKLQQPEANIINNPNAPPFDAPPPYTPYPVNATPSSYGPPQYMSAYPTQYASPPPRTVVVQSAQFDAGARFDGIAQPRIPPPPPGCPPNAAQMAMMQAQPGQITQVVVTKKKSSFWKGGGGGGFSFW